MARKNEPKISLVNDEIFNAKKLSSINPKAEPLTVEILRQFEGLENVSDEEAQEIVFTLQAFSSILYSFYIDNLKKDHNIDSQQVINKKAA